MSDGSNVDDTGWPSVGLWVEEDTESQRRLDWLYEAANQSDGLFKVYVSRLLVELNDLGYSSLC